MKIHGLPAQSGITLIETVLYIALFSILVGGTVVAVFGLIESQGRNQTHDLVEEEGNYLVGKIDWLLGSATSVTLTPDNTMVVTRASEPSKNPYVVSQVGSDLYLYYAGELPNPLPLNNKDLSVSSLTFSDTSGITTSFTLSTHTPNGAVYSELFTTTKYLRQ